MTTETKDIWALLDEDAPDGCDEVQSLYQWSLNFDAGTGPMTLFLDLIGWSEDEIGEPLYNMASANLGYMELSYLADALKQYADHPQEVTLYVQGLMAAEMEA
jgi:hypothetical protein